MIESLLSELSALGWTISWAFQFEQDHWRVSLIHYEDIGTDQQTYTAHCADAPTLASAIEDAISKIAEAEVSIVAQPNSLVEPRQPKIDLASALGLRSAPIRRRV